MKGKLDRIMDIFTRLVCGQEFLGPNEIRPLVAAILSEPDVIVVEGVEWVPQLPTEYQAMVNGELFVMESNADEFWRCMKGLCLVGNNWTSDLLSALSAASRAIKETK